MDSNKINSLQGKIESFKYLIARARARADTFCYKRE